MPGHGPAPPGAPAMDPRVVWMSRAHAARLTDRDKERFAGELLEAFAAEKPASITVYGWFTGYSDQLESKVILAVEVASPAGQHTHIGKLGEPGEVSNDYDGWQKCVTS